MAFQATSIIHDALKGTQSVHVNAYALESAGIVDEYEASKANGFTPTAGTKVALMGQATTNLTGTASSSGTAVTGSGTAFTTELSVGSIISNAAGDEFREVTAITDDTNLTVDSAFTTDLSSEQPDSVDSVYHVDTVRYLRPFQAMCHFNKSIGRDVAVSTEAVVQSLES
ncbi:MAG: hypothetical protein HRU21_09345 [Pseudomonadales bacterium]|nr:hypothetical protein [Pseudomonadales bacterium]